MRVGAALVRHRHLDVGLLGKTQGGVSQRLREEERQGLCGASLTSDGTRSTVLKANKPSP